LKKERRLLKSGQWTLKEYSPKDIFFLQVRDNLFCRPDVTVRYLAIENYYGQNDFGFELYAKLQEIRRYKEFSDKAVIQFRHLIDSYEKNGYNPESFIIADKRLRLRDGAHRLALALYFSLPVITTAVYDSETFGNFSYQWYRERGLTQDEIDTIHNKSEQLREKFNTPLQCIVWEESKTDEVIGALSRFGTIASCEKINISAEDANKIKDILPRFKNTGNVYPSSGNINLISLKLSQPLYSSVKFLQQPVLIQYQKAAAVLSRLYKKNRWQNIVTIPSCFQMSDLIGDVFSDKFHNHS